jgi:uncharacterized protein (DUF1778 family)
MIRLTSADVQALDDTTQATARSPKDQRVYVRVSEAEKNELEHAAALSGKSLSAFIADAVHREVRETIRENAVIRLSRDAAAALHALIENPPQPSPEVRAAFDRAPKLG